MGVLERNKKAALSIHVVSCIIVLCSLWALHFNDFQGKSEAYNNMDYEKSEQFRTQFFETVEAAMVKIKSNILFESDGELDLGKEFIQIYWSDKDKTTDYTIEDLIRYGKSKGIYLDNHNIAQNDDTNNGSGEIGEAALIWSIPELEMVIDSENYVLESLENGDKFISIDDLTYYILVELGAYYTAAETIGEESNFKYRLEYTGEYGSQYIYTNSDDKSIEDLRELKGSYLFNDTNSIKMETNLGDVDWPLINEWIESNNFYKSSSYSFMMIVDESYPVKTDSFYLNKSTYVTGRQIYILSNLLLGIGLVAAGITLLYLAYISGNDKEDGKNILTKYDKGPVELALILGIVLAYLSNQGILLFMDRMYITDTFRGYSKVLASNTLLYFFCVLGLFSLIRRGKSKQLWKNSLLVNGVLAFRNSLNKGHFFIQTAVYFIVIVLINGVSFYFFGRYRMVSIIAACILNGYALFSLWRKENDRFILKKGVDRIVSGETDYRFELSKLHNSERILADQLNQISEGLKNSLEELMKSERLKTDLITNVSHDIKTPLTSIINYVDLIKREPIENEKIQHYIEVLDQKAFRLKTLTDDLVEASKASSGNIQLELIDLDLVELVNQTNGEFEEKFIGNQLQMITNLPEEAIMIRTDGRRLWRVLENLYNNALKYAMIDTRVYIDVTQTEKYAAFSIKNVSKFELNIDAKDLTKRFVRGDISRSTEGSGLGLSIAKSLTTLMGGSFELYIDGDLFKAIVKLPKKDL